VGCAKSDDRSWPLAGTFDDDGRPETENAVAIGTCGKDGGGGGGGGTSSVAR
jgi:hypothetical protein